jgi:hypothetical protein
MKTRVFVLVAFVCSFNLQAYSNFIENPYTPYPPGCLTIPDTQSELYGDNVARFYEGEIRLTSARNNSVEVPANLNLYRVACAEPNRSVVWVELIVVTQMDPADMYKIPYGWAWTPSKLVEIALRPPNGAADNWGGWGIDASWYVLKRDTASSTEGGVTRWWLVLTNAPQNLYRGDYDSLQQSPTEYNENFELDLNWDYSYAIPSTASLFSEHPHIPLSGRLSGNWVVEGASDQGLVIAISEPVPDTVPGPEDLADSSLLMFLSWYTYDANGNKLWLTGSSQFVMGDTEVTIPIEKVTHGQFMGSETADREVVGNVTITGNNCNDLSFQYDLSDIGLGSGTEHLERLFSLETAGYVCRDLEARMTTR